METDSPVTLMLRDARLGRDGARERLADLMYTELRALAGALMADERAAHTLQPTALVHEAYVRLVRGVGLNAQDRGHFMAIAAKAMRQVLIDHARAKRADKRGGGRVFATENTADSSPLSISNQNHPNDAPHSMLDVLDLDDALQDLARLYPRAARVVELRFFGGLSVADAAIVLGTAEPTVERDWSLARGWLRRRLAATDKSEATE
jgi:RNA polymerase sigma-70 factor, ECF subfamily